MERGAVLVYDGSWVQQREMEIDAALRELLDYLTKIKGVDVILCHAAGRVPQLYMEGNISLVVLIGDDEEKRFLFGDKLEACRIKIKAMFEGYLRGRTGVFRDISQIIPMIFIERKNGRFCQGGYTMSAIAEKVDKIGSLIINFIRDSKHPWHPRNKGVKNLKFARYAGQVERIEAPIDEWQF